MPKDLTNAGGQFASKDPTQNTTVAKFIMFLNSLKLVVRPDDTVALRNDLDLLENGQIPYLAGQSDETTESWKDIQTRLAASQIYDTDKTLLRLFVQLPVEAPPVTVDTPDQGKVQMPCGYVNAAQFQAAFAKVQNWRQCQALLDSVYAGPNNEHLAKTAFPHGHNG